MSFPCMFHEALIGEPSQRRYSCSGPLKILFHFLLAPAVSCYSSGVLCLSSLVASKISCSSLISAALLQCVRYNFISIFLFSICGTF